MMHMAIGNGGNVPMMSHRNAPIIPIANIRIVIKSFISLSFPADLL